MIRFSLMAICGFCCQPKNMHTMLRHSLSLSLSLYIYVSICIYIHICLYIYIHICLSVIAQCIWHLQTVHNYRAHLSIVILLCHSHWLTLSSLVIINQTRKPQKFPSVVYPPSPRCLPYPFIGHKPCLAFMKFALPASEAWRSVFS